MKDLAMSVFDQSGKIQEKYSSTLKTDFVCDADPLYLQKTAAFTNFCEHDETIRTWTM